MNQVAKTPTPEDEQPGSFQELVAFDAHLGGIFSNPVKDRAWLDSALDALEGIPALSDLYFIRRSLYLHICSWYHSSITNTTDRKVADTLYVMASDATGSVKIGRTYFDVKTRAKQLSTGCPDIRVVAEFPGEGWREPYLHRKFIDLCVGGEWFRMTPDDAVAAINAEIQTMRM